MISPVRHISLKRVLGIFLSYDPLSFYQQSPQDLDGGIPKNFTKCQALEEDDHLPKNSNGVFDFINEKYGLEREPERREVFSLIASLEVTRKGFQNFFDKAEKSKLRTEIKGEIFWVYLRLCIKDICLFSRSLKSRK